MNHNEAATHPEVKLTEEQCKLISEWWNPIATLANSHARDHEYRDRQWKGIEAIAHALFRYLPTVVSKDLVIAWLQGYAGPDELDFQKQFIDALKQRIQQEAVEEEESPTPSADWVVIGGARGELCHCTRCGQGLKVQLPIPVEHVVWLTNGFVGRHSKCEQGEFKEPVPATLHDWWNGRDSGVSSKTIVDTYYPGLYSRGDKYFKHDIPHDPADFGRCYRLFQSFPTLRDGFKMVGDLNPDWKPLVENWAELTKLYEEELPTGKCPKLYARMQELRKATEAPQ